MFKIIVSLILISTSFNAVSALLDFQTCVQQTSNPRSGQARLTSDLIIATCKEKVAKAQKLENDFGSVIAEKWISIDEIREADDVFNKFRVTNNTTDRTVKYIRLEGRESKRNATHIWTEKTGVYYFFKVNVRPSATATLILPEKYSKGKFFSFYSTGTLSSVFDRINTNDKFFAVSIDPLNGIDLDSLND